MEVLKSSFSKIMLTPKSKRSRAKVMTQRDQESRREDELRARASHAVVESKDRRRRGRKPE
jgi:hypothetical protein